MIFLTKKKDIFPFSMISPAIISSIIFCFPLVVLSVFHRLVYVASMTAYPVLISYCLIWLSQDFSTSNSWWILGIGALFALGAFVLLVFMIIFHFFFIFDEFNDFLQHKKEYNVIHERSIRFTAKRDNNSLSECNQWDDL